MVEVDFGEQGGGKREFRDAAALARYLEDRRQEWEQANLHGPSNELGNLMRPWARLKREVETNPELAPEQLAAVVHQSAFHRQLVSMGSEAGQAIIGVNADLGSAAATAAMRFLLAAPGDAALQDMRKDALEGVLAFRDRLAGISTAKSQATRAAITKLKSDLANDVLEHRLELEEFEGQHKESIEALKQALETQGKNWTEWVDETQKGIVQDRNKWEANWLELYNAYTEKLALEAPVKLWADQADAHGTRAGTLRRWVIGVGVVGTVLAVGVAAAVLSFGHWLLAEYGGTQDGVTPTELIFAASATLLYLTLFFWAMRIVVRMYMTEQHLGIDARSRAAMAQTYLALTKEQVATDQDRAIVLGSLFRPVVDGIVKDDGLPAITPAAILAGLIGGKGHQ